MYNVIDWINTFILIGLNFKLLFNLFSIEMNRLRYLDDDIYLTKVKKILCLRNFIYIVYVVSQTTGLVVMISGLRLPDWLYFTVNLKDSKNELTKELQFGIIFSMFIGIYLYFIVFLSANVFFFFPKNLIFYER